MTRKEAGFTLVELLITMLMSGFIITAAASSFVGLLSQSRTQGKISESNENLVGLELMRRDIETASYGLFWDTTTLPYTAEPTYPGAVAFAGVFNEGTTGAPRAIIGTNNATTFTGTDSMFNLSSYLVIKSMNVARNNASDKWTYVMAGPTAKQWSSTPGLGDELKTGDYVIVVNLRDKTSRPLVIGANFYTTYGYNNGAGGPGTDSIADATMAPLAVANGGAANDVYSVYGINSVPVPARPFNRADYFISSNTAALEGAGIAMPTRCAQNTGILYKAVMNHAGAGLAAFTYEPLLDCVANMQVYFGLDTDGDGAINGYQSDITALTATQIRTQVKEVRVYVLTHEGRRDPTFTYPSANILVGDAALGIGNLYPLGGNTNYRWKVYQLIVKPYNLLN